MRMHHYLTHKINVTGGTLLSIAPSIGQEDILLTGALGIIGALFSFVSSLLFAFLWKQLRKRFKRKRK